MERCETVEDFYIFLFTLTGLYTGGNGIWIYGEMCRCQTCTKFNCPHPLRFFSQNSKGILDRENTGV